MTLQIAAGKTPSQINEYLSQFDVWDRYDYDGDGNFDEPDGYIDTFQSVHAGLGEEEGGAPWTIWSHSWYAHYGIVGLAGPAFNMAGGIQIGNSDYWLASIPSSPRTAAWACSPMSLGTTLACRTFTTITARTGRASGP